MRLDTRILIPAALAAGALALPMGAVADPPADHIFCPNNGDLNSTWVPTSTFVQPDAAAKDNNGDTFVCKKVDNDEPVKDNNNPLQPGEYVDNIVP